ncbi:MAG: tetratricopeptide repeat protein [Verrucomicrobiales bacterium]
MQDYILRGRLLREQGRYPDAEAYFRQAIGASPDQVEAYIELALCLLPQEGRRREALEIIDRCIQLEPDHAFNHALRSLILSRLARGRDASAAADQAIGLDPDGSFNHTVKAEAMLVQEKWKDAEMAARKALALDSDNTSARNLLALALQYQGRNVEASVAVETLLADAPDSPFAHLNAGWACLRSNDHQQAEVHFRESLRLDASLDAAREGLIESFKARSWLYRLYLRYHFFMQRIQSGPRWALIIGLILAVNLGSKVLQTIHPLASTVLITAYLIFVLWVWLASGIGHFLILLDPSARLALKPKERAEGIAVGGGLLAGIACITLGILWDSPAFWLLGAGLGCGAMPASLYFTNESSNGRWIFGLFLAFLYGGGLILAVTAWISGAKVLTGRSETFITMALIGTMLCTWIGNIPTLRQEKPR